MDGLGGYADAEHGTELEEADTPQPRPARARRRRRPRRTGRPRHHPRLGSRPPRPVRLRPRAVRARARRTVSAAGLDFELRAGRRRRPRQPRHARRRRRDHRPARRAHPRRRGAGGRRPAAGRRARRRRRGVLPARARAPACSSCCGAPASTPQLTDTDPQHTGVPPLARASRSTPRPSAPPSSSPSSTPRSRTLLADEPKANVVLLRGFDTHRELPGLRASATACAPPRSRSTRCTAASPACSAWTCSAVPPTSPSSSRSCASAWDDYDYFFLHHKYTDSAGEDGDRAAQDRRDRAARRGGARSCATLGPDVIAVSGDHSTPSARWRRTRGTRCRRCCGASAAAATTSSSSASAGAVRAGSASAPPRTSWRSCSPTPAALRSTAPDAGWRAMTVEPEPFDLHMSDTDALMWNIEKDPVLRSTIVTVNRLDRAPDWDRLVDAHRLRLAAHPPPAPARGHPDHAGRAAALVGRPRLRPHRTTCAGSAHPSPRPSTPCSTSPAPRRWPASTGPGRCGSSRSSRGSEDGERGRDHEGAPLDHRRRRRHEAGDDAVRHRARARAGGPGRRARGAARCFPPLTLVGRSDRPQPPARPRHGRSAASGRRSPPAECDRAQPAAPRSTTSRSRSADRSRGSWRPPPRRRSPIMHGRSLSARPRHVLEVPLDDLKRAAKAVGLLAERRVRRRRRSAACAATTRTTASRSTTCA